MSQGLRAYNAADIEDFLDERGAISAWVTCEEGFRIIRWQFRPVWCDLTGVEKAKFEEVTFRALLRRAQNLVDALPVVDYWEELVGVGDWKRADGKPLAAGVWRCLLADEARRRRCQMRMRSVKTPAQKEMVDFYDRLIRLYLPEG